MPSVPPINYVPKSAGLVKKMPPSSTSECIDRLEARQRRFEDFGGGCRLADEALHQSGMVGNHDLRGFCHLARIGDDVLTPFDNPFHDSRAASL